MPLQLLLYPADGNTYTNSLPDMDLDDFVIYISNKLIAQIDM